MSLRDLQFKQSYSSDEDNILLDFYIPALKESIRYERLAGYFSSSSLAVAARGIINLIKNDGNMQIVASPALSKKDIQAIESAKSKPEDYVSEIFIKDIETLQEGFLYDHLKALGWMIANNLLHLRLAFVTDNLGKLVDIEKIEETGLFHQKVGILTDAYENSISFSGSINESASGWLSNIEEFKVFRSWIDAENVYLKTDKEKYNRIWNENLNRITVIDAPQAIKGKLISIKPENIDMVNWDEYIKVYSDSRLKKIILFDHQNEAISRWINNGKKGIFEMATGTGKTFAALGCIEKAFPIGSKYFTIIACPQKHLIRQWKNEIDAFRIIYDKLIIADGDNPKYKNQLTEAIIDISLGYLDNFLVLTTHRTLASKDFRNIVQSQKKHAKIFLIADEVHGLGASMNKKALIEDYNYRLGLSATPKRWYDDIGTDYLYTYFKDVVYEFDIKLALNSYNPMTGKTYLTPYKYYPKRVFLCEDELEEYIRLTHNIIKSVTSKNGSLDEDILQILRNARANITKNAEYKFSVLEEVINEIGFVSSTIVFCSPQQIQQVMGILNKHGLTIHRFTEKEGTKIEKQYGNISQREYLIKKFSEGVYQALVAIKCIDEGVDVPNARIAILMSSSTNPREYIQRIGRVVRRAPGKTEAKIYDFIVAPNTDTFPEELQRVEKLILEKEFVRAEDIAKNAINNAEAFQELHKMKISKLRR